MRRRYMSSNKCKWGGVLKSFSGNLGSSIYNELLYIYSADTGDPVNNSSDLITSNNFKLIWNNMGNYDDYELRLDIRNYAITGSVYYTGSSAPQDVVNLYEFTYQQIVLYFLFFTGYSYNNFDFTSFCSEHGFNAYERYMSTNGIYVLI